MKQLANGTLHVLFFNPEAGDMLLRNVGSTRRHVQKTEFFKFLILQNGNGARKSSEAHLIIEIFGDVNSSSIRVWLDDVINVLPALSPHVSCKSNDLSVPKLVSFSCRHFSSSVIGFHNHELCRIRLNSSLYA